ncbi:MAG: methionyl-tRNA formyltransferase [Candidatus Gastranaerophilales bacterium]|nr:methionyl-tRNA formyltransferase [Candidatus Gastranaerophilales bacterium]
MRILFFGVPDMGIICFNALVAKHLKSLVGVVPPAPTHAAFTMMMSAAEEHNLPCIYFSNSPKEKPFIEKIKQLEPDIGIVCAFNHLISQEIIDIFPQGIINCHPSLLPDYRGGNPYFHVIANNEEQTGVTFHYMDSSFDTGDIIYQRKIPLAKNETIGTLFNKLNMLSAQMVVELVDNLESGQKLPRVPQINHENLRKAPSVKQEIGDTFIKWEWEAYYIESFIRACNPFWGAVTNFRGCLTKIWSGYYASDKTYSNVQLGTIVEVSTDKIGILTGKGVFYPTCFTIGSFVLTEIKDFISRTNPKVGERFLS